ncbi:Dicamba O-demethylase 1, ferredoxin reductase component [Paraconexibacter sp. AEG42_29]|uniref:Dicamba O-demethylase 1, ferredoxin reductase component n=1 Tax=Paraconexibacter sp. AEG42_29 TaxID=2997339 RepID=A0AAU7AZZ8_9ACTN
MAERTVDVLLIGGGVASANVAITLRENGFDGSILLVGRELDPPYHRPPVTKGFLQGKESKEDGYIALPDDVEVLTRTSVMSLDGAAKVAKLSTKDEVSFTHAVVATGAMVRRLPLDGANLDGLHYLRAPGNADALRADAEKATNVVMVGGSYIGCETAASLTAMGKSCTVLMMEEHPFDRHFGTTAAQQIRSVLEANGVTVRGGVDVEAFVGEGEAVEGVQLAGGEVVPADLVVVGVGAQPDVMLARKSGLPIGDLGGVSCGPGLAVTGFDGIYAAGDMCEYESTVHGRTLRVEHEEHAAAQGATVARAILGSTDPHTEVPYFFSDLADWLSLEYVGPAADWDSEVVDGSVEDGAYSVTYLDASKRVVACLSVGGHGDLDAARAQMASGEPVASA